MKPSPAWVRTGLRTPADGWPGIVQLVCASLRCRVMEINYVQRSLPGISQNWGPLSHLFLVS